MANKRFIDFPIATTVGDNDIILIWQGGANKQTTKATILSGVPDSLNDLTDVTISGLTNGQILRYDSVTGQWENTDQGNLDLNDLNDVTIVSPTNGQVLVYNSSTSKWENSSGGYVPYVGAVTTVDLGLQGLEAGYVRFDTSIVSVPDEQGLMYWDASKSTVALIMNGTLQHIGQDTFFYVKNSSGSSIPKGTCVRFAGTDGASGHLLITPFLANGSVPSTYFLGVTAETITNGSFGQVMHFGELEGINTSSYTAGDLLYASTTVAGAFQTTAPVAPNNIVLVAAAVNSKNNGAIVVRPTYGSNINNDEGVKITSPTTGDLLQLQAGGLWENKTIDAAGIVTKATNQTITGVKTFSQDIIVNGVNVGRGGGNRTENTSTGNSALSANTTGSGNTANGSFALFKNTSGGGNTALGTQSLTENTTGSGNTGLGLGSLYKNTSGSNNSSLGNLSLYENTTGQTNVGIGFYALFKNTTGSDNTALGYTSGAYIADGSTANSISNNSVYIGAYTKALANNQTNQIVIGHNAIGGGSNTVVIGNSSILSNRFFGTMRIGTINNGVGDFITTDANGVLTKRTGAEVRTDIGAGTVTSVAALTLGTSGTDLSSTVANGTTTPVITLNVPTASATNRGVLSAADWSTFNAKQNALTLTTIGTSGAATLVGATLNIPNYGSALSGYLPLTGGTLTGPLGGTIANFSNTLQANTTTITNGTRSWIISPSGASINHEFAGVVEGKIDPSSGGNSWFGATSGTTGAGAKHYFASTGAATFASSVTGSSFIRVGGTSVEFLKADGSVDSTTYVTIARTITINGTSQDLSANRTFNVGTVTSVTASSPLASSGGSTPNITIQQASGSQSGFLSSTDWTTFNNKQNALTNPVTGTGTTNYLPKFTGASTIGNSLVFDNGTSVGIGTPSPNSNSRLHVYRGGGSYDTIVADGDAGTNTGYAIYEGGSPRYALYSNGGGGNDSFNIYNFGAASNSFTIYTSGNVGINSSSDNGARLQVSGAATFSSNVTTTGGFLLFPNNYGVEGRNAANTAHRTVLKLNTSNQIEIGRDTDISSIILGTASAVNAMTITSGGNVGIGTPSPSFQLHVNRAGNTGIFLSNTTGNSAGYLYAGGLDGFEIQSVDSSNSTAKKLILQPYGGNVLIGTATDNGARLQVSGTATFSSTVTVGTDLTLNNGTLFVSAGSGQAYSGRLSTAYIFPYITTYLDSFAGAGWEGRLQFRTNSAGGAMNTQLTILNSGAATFSSSVTTGAPAGGTAQPWKLGTVATVSPTSPNRTIEVEVNGTTYYLHAKTTNN